MATLEQIAQATGLSTSTISRALRGQHDVSETTKTLVSRAVEHLGHGPRPGKARRGRPPKGSRKPIIAVVCKTQDDLRANPFFEPILNAALDSARELGAQSIAVEWPADLEAMPGAFDKVDGALTICVDIERVRQLAARMPTVSVDAYLPGSGADGVVASYRQGAFEAVSALISKGHERIALLAAHRRAGEGYSEQVYDGARRAMDLAGLPLPSFFIAGNVITPETGHRLATELLSAPIHERPTALLGSDHAMLGAIRAALDLGLKVPDDVAVVGVDDIELGRYAVPRLSTVRVDKEAMARTALERILWRLRFPQTAACSIHLDCAFIERDSS